MSELIKSVRIRPIEGSTDDLKIGRLDTKVSLFRDNRRTRNCIGYSISSTGDELGVNWSLIEYQGRRYNDLSDDDIIKDYIRTNTLKERPREGEFVNLEGNQVPFYKIVQDPFEKTPPSVRIYGSDPYYLNNGCQVFIRWYINSNSELISIGGEKYGSKSNQSYAIDGFIDDTRDSITQSISIKPEGLVKTVEVVPPGEDEVWVISSKSDDHISNFFPVYKKDLNESIGIKYFSDNSYNGDFSKGQDWMILSSLLSAWNKSIPNYNVQLCQPSFIENIEIEYKDPLKPADELVTEPEPEVVDNSKIKLNISFSDNFQVKVREDSPEFTITVGDIIDPDEFIFSDNDEELDDEFREVGFLGPEEELLQEEISVGQEDSSRGSNEVLDEPIPLSASSGGLDSLLRNAGKIARILGKNSRVKYENLSMGYKKGIHGLCPQGTQAVLVALIGIKELGLIRGNADWFSFKNPATNGAPYGTGKGFDSLVNGKSYYKPKIKIEQVNGSWKNTYLNDKTKWQVGDIIAMGYTGGKLYGHIQIWTGFCWMSDFKQNAIQQSSVDPNTVALWRLNENGINLLKDNRFIS